MKTIDSKLSFGTAEFHVPVKVYETLEEINTAAQSPEKIVALVNKSAFPSFALKTLIVKTVSDLTKVPFLTINKKNKKTGKITAKRDMVKDSDVNYVTRALKASGVTVAQVNDELAKRSTLSTDVSPTAVNVNVVEKLNGKFKKSALPFLTGKLSLEKFNQTLKEAGFEAWSPVVPIEDDKPVDPQNLESLAWAIQRWQYKINPLAAGTFKS